MPIVTRCPSCERRLRVQEVAGLLQLPQPFSREARQGLGYKEVIEHLQGRATLDQTVARVQQRSRNFAKRQITWFRHLPGCLPVCWELTSTAWDHTMKVKPEQNGAGP